jgi:hypothetical protein
VRGGKRCGAIERAAEEVSAASEAMLIKKKSRDLDLKSGVSEGEWVSNWGVLCTCNVV